MAKRSRKTTSVDGFVAAGLRERRALLGMSQQQLAEIIGMT